MALKESFLQAAGELISHQAVLTIRPYAGMKNNSFQKKENANTITQKASAMLNQKKNQILEKSLPKLNQLKNSMGIETGTLRDGVIVVQYNPASIKYSGKTSEDTNEKQEENEKITTVTNTGTIDMSFDLVFHSKYPTDTSVQEQMDLMMNMLYKSPTRELTFAWANMETTGVLTSFSGKYDMFDTTGNPISGTMSLTIQSKVSVQKVSRMLTKTEEERNDKEQTSKEESST